MKLSRAATSVLASSSLGLLLLLQLPLAAAAQAASVGQVKSISGTADVLRGGRAIPATVGMVLLESDVVRTGADGRLGLTLRDETRLSFGPGTTLELRKFAYEPVEARLALTVRLLQGTLSYISGRIAKLAPSSVTIETPTSVIGVRGTHLVVSVE